MRLFVFIVLIGILMIVNGCQDGFGNANLTFNIINQLTGNPVIGTEVRLVTNGVPGPEFEGVDTSQIVVPDVPPDDDYSVILYTPIGSAPVWFGPFRVAGSPRTFDIQVLTYQQLLASYGVAQPTNNTVTLVVFGYDRFGGTPLEVQVNVDNSAYTGTGTPAIVTGIPFPPAIHNVILTATATGQTVQFPSLLFTNPNIIMVVRASFAEVR